MMEGMLVVAAQTVMEGGGDVEDFCGCSHGDGGDYNGDGGGGENEDNRNDTGDSKDIGNYYNDFCFCLYNY